MRNMPTAYKRRGQPKMLLIGTLTALIVASLPVSLPVTAELSHERKINSLEYKKTHGFWETIELPKEFRLNSMHAATLPTGKVLLVAGSGNNRENFNSFANEGTIAVLKTVIFDPDTKKVKSVATPSDLFCGGHAHLQTGNLLVAGGTSGYELLEDDVTKPAGAMVIHNENPDDAKRTLKKGTKFISPSGKVYLSTSDVIVKPAQKMDHGGGDVMIHPSSITVFVEAIEENSSYVTDKNEQYKIDGLTGVDAQNLYGQGGPMTLNKQDFRGDNQTYEFDPFKEEYVKVGDMNESRWYPSLPVLANGDVLAVSGLDKAGVITETTELYSPSTKEWSWGPNLAIPTYPALFRTNDPNVLFFSGSNAGYGPADKGRDPGFWNIKDNSFTKVPGLRDTDMLETSGSVMLPPKKGSNDGSQSSRIMLAGGGGIGESPLSTARTDIIDINDPKPRYVPGPDLPEPLRYINLTVTPWDEVIAAGGSQDYRGKQNSYSNATFSIDPNSNQITPLADELVPRAYHSGSLLLPDGRILFFGNDPLYSDEKNTTPGVYDQSLEIYTPPQLYRGQQPTLIGEDNRTVQRGQDLRFTTGKAKDIKTARIIPMNSTTHVTNVEQRSVAAIVKSTGADQISIRLPNEAALLPKGWYMLFVTNQQGIPSQAKMIMI